MPTRPAKHRPLHYGKLPVRLRDYSIENEARMAVPELKKAVEIRNSGRWKRLRMMFIRSHPLCNDPFGTHIKSAAVVPAVEVDHVAGLRDSPDQAFAMENLQSLCKKCHARKTAQENRSTRRKAT